MGDRGYGKSEGGGADASTSSSVRKIKARAKRSLTRDTQKRLVPVLPFDAAVDPPPDAGRLVRLVECGAEDFRYGLAINRIRGYYKQLAGDQANLFLLSGHDDGRGVFANASVPPDGRTQYFTFGSVVAVINSVVGGSAVAIALGAFVDASLGVAAGAGGVAAILSVVALLRHADRLLDARTGGVAALFPSPPVGRAPTPVDEH